MVALGVAEGKAAGISLSVKSLGAAGKDSYFLLTKPFPPMFATSNWKLKLTTDYHFSNKKVIDHGVLTLVLWLVLDVTKEFLRLWTAVVMKDVTVLARTGGKIFRVAS